MTDLRTPTLTNGYPARHDAPAVFWARTWHLLTAVEDACPAGFDGLPARDISEVFKLSYSYVSNTLRFLAQLGGLVSASGRDLGRPFHPQAVVYRANRSIESNARYRITPAGVLTIDVHRRQLPGYRPTDTAAEIRHALRIHAARRSGS